MTLSASEIAEIMRLIDESSFDELNLEMNGVKLQMRRSGRGRSVPAPEARAQAPAGEADAPSRAPEASSAPPVTAPPAAASSGASGRDIPAPLLGTFYRAPKPGAAPFVDLGTEVEEDTVVGIIEVMKLMNTVRAGLRGVITEILAADGQLVEYGSVLMRVGDGG
jgi:acetyl-CoA carboxylase biotin carboxyl carrier protein